MIKMDDVSRHYGDFPAVDGISMEIGEGEIVGLLGHNGAGKTTLMKMLTGFIEPSAGRIEVDGHDVVEERMAVQQAIGYLPENCPLYPELSVAAFLEHAATLQGIPEEERWPRIREALAATELRERALQRIDTLSRGLRQRVGVAQAILHRPRILVLDEPTNGLDPTQILHMRALIRRLAERSTVIVSTHILQEVQALCDRVVIIRNGCKVVDSRLEDLQHGRRLLLTTDAAPEALAGALGDLARIDTLARGDDGHHDYALDFTDGAEAAARAPEVARRLVDAGHRLYALQLETRTLESLFGELSADAVVGGRA